MTRALLSWLVALTLCMAVGCGGGKDSNRPKTYQVSGTVTLGGQAVQGATVTFVLDGGGGSSVGTTDAQGKYKLTTFGGNDGARAGAYKVTVAKYDQGAAATGAAGTPASGAIDEKAYNPPAAVPEGAPVTGPKNLLPEKYANPATSQLTANVTDSGKNQFDFALQQ